MMIVRRWLFLDLVVAKILMMGGGGGGGGLMMAGCLLLLLRSDPVAGWSAAAHRTTPPILPTSSSQSTTVGGNEKPPLIIAGAGPAGLMLALCYLQLHPTGNVVMIERRGRPPRCSDASIVDDVDDVDEPGVRVSSNGNEGDIAGDNAFGFGLGPRPQHSLSRIPGLWEAIQAIGHPMTNTSTSTNGPNRTSLSSTSTSTSPTPTPTSYMVNRRDLCAECVSILEQTYGLDGRGRLLVHFNTTVTDIQPSSSSMVESSSSSSSPSGAGGRVRIHDSSTTTTTTAAAAGPQADSWLPYSILVGADGTNSAVRSCMVQQGYIRGRRFSSGSTWKALQLPFQPEITNLSQSLPYKTEHDVGRVLPRFPNRFVLLNFRKSRKQRTNKSRKRNTASSTTTAYEEEEQEEDHRHRHRHDHDHDHPFGATTPTALRQSIQEAVPSVTCFPSDQVLQDWLDQPAGESSYMVLHRHYVPAVQTFLLGDAAVGMYSLLGQGCAYALESAISLAEALAQQPPDGRLDSNDDDHDDNNDDDNDDDDNNAFFLQLQRLATTHRREGKALAQLNLISHILRTRMAVTQTAIQTTLPIIIQGLSDPNTPYADIYTQSRWTLFLARPFWWRARTRTPL